ncbi:hypothetical protein [Nostoc sp. CMAA1605]|uniref:hypothetical protein n=1 Tax=Nostoc sp. CMAA1605 TaxID=2055159 RepID=UPI001F25DB25|nr:hypothetical protein [Nostoc sp. CMAA1605]
MALNLGHGEWDKVDKVDKVVFISQHWLNAALPLTASAKRRAIANTTQHSQLSTQHSYA